MLTNDFKGIIEVNNFTKDYGSNRGVFDVSFGSFTLVIGF